MSSNVEQIKDRLDIVDVISSYIKVEKAGINFKAKCPFHNEKTPSFFISPTRQGFYCFGCGAKGDIFSFVEKFEGLDFKGALEALAKKAGVELKKFKSDERIEEKDKLFEVLEAATGYFEQKLKENKTAENYLKNRGLSLVSMEKWRLGLAEDGWRNLLDYLTSKGFSRENLLETGLIKKVAEENKYYDTFRNRIIFPIFDAAGRVIAFSGRAMKEDDKTPKYLNSPETKLFYKSEVLYGFNIAKNHIRKMDYAVLVEGQMDLLMSQQAGILNTVASSGTALTELHLKKIQKLSNRIIIAYDSDPSGERAAKRAAELALSLGMEVKIAALPKGEDPASVIKTDSQKWKEALKKSEHFIDFALSKALSENEGRNLTREISKSILPLVSIIKDEIEKARLVKKIALKIGAPEEAVWNDLKRARKIEVVGSESDFRIEQKTVNLERLMAGLVYLEESAPGKAKYLRKKWQELIGNDEAEKILSNYEEDREAMIFEAEMHSAGENTERARQDMLKRIELENLKSKLQKTAALLDDKNLSKKEEKTLKSNFDKIQKRIKELNY